MVIKQIFLDKNGQDQLKVGIDKIADAVASTLGPCGQTVLIESENHIGGITVTKDGVTVARSINLYDPVQNLAVQLVKEAASKTAVSAGDGTTTSIVLTRAIIDAFNEFVTEDHSKTQVLRHVQTMTTEMTKVLDKMSKPVSGRRLFDVATISANNDPAIGKIISDVYSEVDHVTVENSKTTSTYTEVIRGIKVDRGYTSRYFITDKRKDECVLEDAYILLADQEIANLASIENILAPIIREQKPLLIIGNLSPQVLATFNLNVAQGKIKFCNIIPPNFGYRKDEMMEDLSIALGAHYYSEKTGDNLSLCTIDGLGRAKKIVVSQDSTIIIPSNEGAALASYVSDLRLALDSETVEADAEFLKSRIASISGGVGIIYVGANSDIEQKELRDRVDDAVLAVRAAKDEGILAGGGVALLDAIKRIRYDAMNDDESAAYCILMSAVFAPFAMICKNAGLDPIKISEQMGVEDGFGYDVKNDKYGNMIKMGIIDPCKVTKNAIKNAVSVATTILSTNAIITNVREDESVK